MPTSFLYPEEVRARLKAAGVSLQRMLDDAGIKRSVFMKWEDAPSSPMLRTVLAITNATDRLAPVTTGQAANRNTRKEHTAHG